MSNNLAVLLAIMAGLTLIFSSLRMRKRVDKAGKNEYRLRTHTRELSAAIRLIATECLHMKRQLIRMAEEYDRIGLDSENIKEKIVEAEKIDRRIYVLDDRRTLADLTWNAVITHANYRTHHSPAATKELHENWQLGRRFIVWALDRERALDKINSRLPKEQGFAVVELEQRKEEAP
ncbi:MAG: hypothetical protein WCF85_15165 [Rhodospirillaceae bacterium]